MQSGGVPRRDGRGLGESVVRDVARCFRLLTGRRPLELSTGPSADRPRKLDRGKPIDRGTVMGMPCAAIGPSPMAL